MNIFTTCIQTEVVASKVEEKEKAAETKLEDIISKLKPEEITAKGLRDPTFVEEYFKPALEEKDSKDKVTKIKLSQESLDKEIHERQKKELDEQDLLLNSMEEEAEVTPTIEKVEEDIAEEIGVDDELRALQACIILYCLLLAENLFTRFCKRLDLSLNKIPPSSDP